MRKHVHIIKKLQYLHVVNHSAIAQLRGIKLTQQDI